MALNMRGEGRGGREGVCKRLSFALVLFVERRCRIIVQIPQDAMGVCLCKDSYFSCSPALRHCSIELAGSWQHAFCELIDTPNRIYQ